MKLILSLEEVNKYILIGLATEKVIKDDVNYKLDFQTYNYAEFLIITKNYDLETGKE